MSLNPAIVLHRLQIALVAATVLSGSALFGLFVSAFFGMRQLPFQLLWSTHLFVHIAAVAIAITLIIHLGRELLPGGAWFYLSLFFLMCGFLTLSAMTPWWSPHALSLDLPLARWWRQAGRMIELPWYESSYLPSTMSLVYAGFFDHRIDFLMGAYHASYGVILAGLLALFVHYKTREEELSLWAALVLLCNPFVITIAGQPTNTLVAACFLGLAYGSAIVWGEQRAKWWILIVPGLSFGFACLVSGATLTLTGAFAISLLGFYLSWKFSLFRASAAVLSILVVAGIATAPWMLRNFIWVGNPLFPLFRKTHGPLEMSAFHYEWCATLLILSLGVIPLVRKSRNLHKVAPWARATWFFTIVGGVCIWGSGFQSPYELVILLLPLVLLSGVGIEQLMERKQATRPATMIRSMLAGQCLLALMLGFWTGSAQSVLKFFFQMSSAPQYLAENVPGYVVSYEYNNKTHRSAGVLLLNTTAPIYTIKRPVVGISPDGAMVSAWVKEEPGPGDLARRFLLQGASHLICGGTALQPCPLQSLSPQENRRWEEFLSQYTSKVFEFEGQRILKLESVGTAH